LFALSVPSTLIPLAHFVLDFSEKNAERGFFYNAVQTVWPFLLCRLCGIFFTSQHVPPRLIPASPSQGKSKGTPCLEEAKALDPRPPGST
jgi:hypothetical protein